MSLTNQDPYQQHYARRVHGMKASEIRALFDVANRPEIVSLAGGMPCTAALPLEEIAQLCARLMQERGASALQYATGQGDRQLREIICDVMSLEEIYASPDDVVVTVGSQHALTILAAALINPGDVVLAEGPSYVGALGAFSAAEAEVVHISMDEEGLPPESFRDAVVHLIAQGRKPKFLYTVPNYHNPGGVTLTRERRAAILEIAAIYDLLIVEDNPYGLLGFDNTHLPAMRADDSDRVIYVGSFSKTFSPGLRTGWILAPTSMRRKLVLINEAQILCPSSLTQSIIIEYFTHYAWREQIKAFQVLYQERRNALCEALTATMPTEVKWNVPAGGFYVWLTLPEGMDSKALLPHAITAGVAYVPGIGFFADGQGANNLRLSYCFPPSDVITEGINRFATALTTYNSSMDAVTPMA